MKNLFKAFAVLTCGAFLTASLTSCHSSREEINEVSGQSMKNVVTNTLKVKFNSPLPAGAVIKYGSFTYTATGGETEVVIDPAAESGTLTLGGTLIAQSVKVNFSDRSTLVYEFDVAENAPASAQVPAATVQGGATVNNDGDNQTKTGGVAASFQLVSSDGSSVTPTNAVGLTNPYSLVVFTPAYIPVAKVEKKDYDYAPYAVACQPDGATFDKPAKLSVTVEGASEIGADGFQYQNGSDKPATSLSGDNVEAYVTHFSNWNIILKATCIEGPTEGSVQLAAGSLTAGKNTITYAENFGFTTDAKGVLAKWLKCLFGATATTVDKKATIDAKSNGTYTVKQKTFTYKFKAGNKNFEATVYGEVTWDATYTGGEENKPSSETPSHSGGTGNQPK